MKHNTSLRFNDNSLQSYCQRLHRQEMRRLWSKHSNGRGGFDIAVSRSILIDRLIQTLYETLKVESRPLWSSWEPLNNGTWVAAGEFGCMELSPHSQVDLLILIKSNQRVVPNEVLEEIRALFEFSGIACQIIIATPKECLHRALNSVPFSAKLLSARHVAGDTLLFKEVFTRFRVSVLKNPLSFVFEISDYLKRVHEEHGRDAYWIESGLTLGAGGLFDGQILLGCMRVLTGSDSPERLFEDRHINPQDWTSMQKAREYLLKVRNAIHFESGAERDILCKQDFEEFARIFGYQNPSGHLASTQFLHDILIQRRRIDLMVSRYLEQARLRYGAGLEEDKLRYLRFAALSATEKGNRDESDTDQVRSEGPEIWMKRFRFSQTEPALFDRVVEDKLLVARSGWDLHSFDLPAVHTEFKLILKNKGRVAIALRHMHALGFLTAYLPEFGRLDCLPELEHYRKYSLDFHTLKAAATLDSIVNTKSPGLHDYQRVLDEVSDPSLIYLALLLHETGKGATVQGPPNHEHFAAKALRRMNLDAESVEKVMLLIREQHLLTRVSQRRDLDDPFILQEVCDTLETTDNLNMLLLFTYADSMAWEDEEWNDRKDFLLWSLYFRVYDRLMFGDEISEPEHAKVAAIQRKVLDQLAGEFEVETILRHFTLLPEKYALYTPLQQILSHIRLCEGLRDKPVVTLWTPHPQAGYTELIVSTLDLPGRFAQIAGTLTALGTSILSAQLNTRDDEIVIDTFQVADTAGNVILDSEVWNRVDRLLYDVITGMKSLEEVLGEHLPAPAHQPAAPTMAPRVRIDNEIASQCTVIEVQAGDRLGLGYLLANAIAELGLNILSAKLATERGYAFDVFYVQNKEGEKITSSFRMTEILERLRAEAK